MSFSAITLRPIEDRDETNIIQILTSPLVTKSYMVPDLTPERAKGLFLRLQSLSREENRFVRGICLDDTLVGFLNDTEVTEDYWELGWAMHPDYMGKGYCTAGVRLAIRALFDRGVPAVLAGAFDWNIASLRVMEKCGMQKIDRTDSIEYRGKVHTCVYCLKKQ